MTTITDTRTLTDQAVGASADRLVHTARAMDRPHRVDADLTVVWQGDRGLFTNVAYVVVEPDDWGGLLARVATVVPAGRPLTLVSPYSVPDLSGQGWELVGHPPLMFRPAGRPPVPVPTGLTLSPVVDDDGLDAFVRTLVDAFPDPALRPYRRGEVFDGRVLGGPTRFFLGTAGGRPVATATGHVAAGVNVVEMVATVPTARGSGYGAALTAAASTVDPALPSVLLSSDLGRPVYERLGFVALSRWTIWHRPA